MMRQGGGNILNVSSARGALRGLAFSSAYCASKHGLMGFSQAMAEELRPHGIRVQVILPDVTDTPLLKVQGDMAMRGLMTPETVAEFIVQMLSLPEDAILTWSDG